MDAHRVEVKALELAPWEECLGVLQGIGEGDGGRVFLVVGSYELVVPRDFLDVEDLRLQLGRRIGVLRTDLEDKPYLVRLIEGE